MSLFDWLEELDTTSAVAQVDLRGTPGQFTAPPGWSVGPIDLNSDLIYFLTEGTLLLTIDRETTRIGAGSLLWISTGLRIHLQRTDAKRLRFWRFRLQAPNTPLDQEWRKWEGLLAGRQWCAMIVEEARRQDALSPYRLRAALTGLVTELLRHDYRPEEGPCLTAAQKAAVEHCLDTTSDWPDLADLARAAALSPDYFSRLFRRTYSLSVRDWLVRERVQVACLHLSESTAAIGEIADRLGYRDTSHFSRQFKQVTGHSPSAWRRRDGLRTVDR